MRARLLGGEAEGESRDSREDELERQLLRRRVKSPLWSIDRGGGAYHEARERNKHPSLVATGR